MENQEKYITTSIVYPNANPHLGYTMELCQGDFLARFYALKGYSVRFVTGIDEHGLKIQNTASKEGKTPEQFVSEKTLVYQKLADQLGLRYDRFIRTSDPDHIEMAQRLWMACYEKGDIYKKTYKAWYNIKEEEFLGHFDENPDPAVFGVDPKFVELIDEENYFFRMSKYQDQIVSLLENEVYQVIPAGRKMELLMFIKDKGLQDISVSRDKSKLSWGVEVPNDPSQVMYVWFDALTNYLTASRNDEGQWWPAGLHVVGKDIARFHGLIWPAMLLSAGYPLPKKLLVHGFISCNGQKMSKSLGNVVDPFPLIADYGSDAVRWYLLREISTTDDGDFSQERFEQVYNSSLANDYGNLVSRVWTMIQKYSNGCVPAVDISTFGNVEEMMVREAWSEYLDYVEELKIHQALARVQDLIVFCNRKIDESKPWVLAKSSDPAVRAELDELLYEMLEIIRHITLMLSPVLVDTADKIRWNVFGFIDDVTWASFDAGSKWGLLEGGSKLGSEQIILFPKR